MKELDRRILEAERRLKELTAIKNGQIKDETKPLLAELEDLLTEYDLNDKILFKIKTDSRLYYDVVYYVPVSLEIRSIENDVVLSKLDVRDLEDEEVLKRIKSYLEEYASRLKLLVELTNRFRFSKFYDGSKKLVIDLGVKNKITVDFSTNNDDVFVSASRVLDNRNNGLSFDVDDDLQLTFESVDDRWPVLSKLKSSISTRPRLCRLDYDEIIDAIDEAIARLDKIDIEELQLYTNQNTVNAALERN